MDYKEKYEQALERARQFSEKPYLEDSAWIVEYIFPELAESEDERIKDRLINYFHGFLDGHEDTYKVGGCVKWEGLDVKDVITWLEKQGEQPKKHDVCDNCDQQGSCVSPCPMKLVEKQGEQKPNPVLDIEIPFGAKDSELQEASYYIPEGFHAEIEGNRVVIKRGKQKPAEWSEEDEEISSAIVKRLEGSCALSVDLQSAICWVENVKGRVQPQPKQEWSEEDEQHIDSLLKRLKGLCGNVFERTRFTISEDEDWLKSLRSRSHWKPSEEKLNALWTASNKYLMAENGNVEKMVGKVLESLYNDLKKLKG